MRKNANNAKEADKTVKIHADWWAEGKWVKLRKHLSYGAQKRLKKLALSYVKVDLAAGDIKIDAQAALVAGNNLEKLLRIYSWNLTDGEGKLLQVNQQGLETLDDDDLNFIQTEINTLSGVKIDLEVREAFLAKHVKKGS